MNKNNNINPSFSCMTSQPLNPFLWNLFPPPFSQPQVLNLIDLTSQNYKPDNLLQSSKTIQKQPINPHPSQKRILWTTSEDDQLHRLMNIYGPKWTKIASLLPNKRTGKQVRDRYMNVLAANSNKKPWTDEEDQAIISMLQEMGPQWGKIAKALKGRTEAQVKDRYRTYLKGQGVTYPQAYVNLADMIFHEKEEENNFFDWRARYLIEKS